MALCCGLWGIDDDLKIPNKIPKPDFSSSFEQNIPKPTQKANELGEGRVLAQVVDLFMKSLKRGAISQAYYAYTSEDFRKTTNFKDFKIFVDRYPALGRNLSYEVLNIDHFDFLASVTAAVTSIDRIENTVSFDVIFESGRWRILGIQVYAKLPTEEE